MPTKEIEEFANLLVKKIRDSTIENLDMLTTPEVADPIAKRWRAAAHGDSLKVISNVLIPDAVDACVCELLSAIDQGVMEIYFKASTGKVIDLHKEGKGELVGWYIGSGGWRSMYSNERYVDDFSDLI